jgi:Family of unknown function (DUF5654)
MIALKDIKSAIAVAIAAAFGFIIALIWKDIIIGIMKLAGLWADGGPTTWNGAGVAIVVGLVITIVSVIGIVLISKWGGVTK